MGSESTAARYVAGGGTTWRDPWPAYAALREHEPVHHVVPEGHPEHDYYVLSRHADVLAAAVDYLGVPEQDRPRFDEWTNAIVAANAAEGTGGAVGGAAGATVELMAYFSALMERRRAEQAAGVMAEDTVSHLVAAAGDPAEEEAHADVMAILGFVFTMVTGGNDTTTGLLGGSMELLATDPGQRDDLAESPGLVPDAVEELLRLTSPVQGLARTTTRDVELHGTVIPAGRRVLLLYAAANRDWRKYGADAEQLDIRRRPTQILTFSQGHHHCLGAAAARLQGRVALEELLARVPRFTVDPDQIEWAPGAYVRRPVSVPLTVG